MGDIIDDVDKSYPLHPATLLKRLDELRSEQYMVDVMLCAEGRDIPCHRLVLAAFSDYFHAMFNGAHCESKKDKIEIGGVSAEALQQLVDYAYTSKINITTENVRPLLEAANMLQVPLIKKDCEAFLKRQLNTGTCLGIWVLADLVSSESLPEKARAIALQHFIPIYMMEEFLQLPVHYLKTYLSDEDLNAKKEEDVLDAIMLWTRHDLEERRGHLEELIECVDFSNVNQDYLKNILKKDKVLAGVRGIRKQIRNLSARARPRQIRQEEILVLGGESYEEEDMAEDPEGVNRKIYRLDLNGICVDKTVMQESFHGSKGIAACVLENDVIVTGGYESLSQAWKYKPAQDSWTQLGSLKNGRSFHGMAVVGGRVYVVGGYDRTCIGTPQPFVEVYHKRTNSWKMRAPLLEPVAEFGITGCQGRIYVFGGQGEHMESNAVQCYDPRENDWTCQTILDKPMGDIKACTVNSKIYLVGGQLECVLQYHYHKDEMYFEKLAERLDAWHYCSATVRGSEIFITGGQRGEPLADLPVNISEEEYDHLYMTKLATLQCYNTSNGYMFMENDVPFKLTRHCTVTIAKD
ncbi:kelch-like protein 3 isoform X2 [Branchiostoma floridae]|nr:kelch-like protein 3 isoform X2 [Branchiostoma floridae]